MFSSARPTGAAAGYIFDMGKILSGATIVDDVEEDKRDKLESICRTLNMTERQLISSEHNTDITKTCHQIVKFIYPDPKNRTAKLVSTMMDGKLEAIQGNASDYFIMICNSSS